MSDGIFRKDAVIKILLVEDNPADARLLREMLAEVTTAQFELTLVERLSDAVQRLSEESFDVTLLDMMLPDSAGLDILLRAQEQAPSVAMIVLTGTFEDEALAVKAVKEGAQDYLFKDQVDGPLLVRSIRYAIERKRAEEELKASQEYLRNLIDCSLDMIIAVDRKRRITEFNRAAEETFGYRREDVLGKDVNSLYADSQVGLEVHKTTVDQGQSVQEILNKRKNGEIFPSLLSASVLLDSRGERVGVMGISREITEQKRAEEELLSSTVSREYVDNIISSMVDTLIVVNPDAAIQSVNQATLELLGYEENGMIGKPIRMIFAEEEEELFTESGIAELIKKRSIRNVEKTYLAKDGRKIPVLFSGSVIRADDGKIQGIVCVAQDITERRRAEETLRRSKEIFNNIVTKSSEGVMIVDREGFVRFINPAAESLFNRKADELVGEMFGLPVVAGESFEVDIVRPGRQQGIGEMRFSETEWRGTAASLVLLRDVTDKKKTEEELKAAQLQLIQAEKLESIGRLAAGVAHEVKNPLAVILMGLHYLSKHVSSRNNKVDGVLIDMNSAVERGTSVIEELLDFSTAGELDLNVEELNAVVEQSLFLVKHELVKYHVTLVKKLSENLPRIELDRNKFKQVLINIFMNAVHAMGKSGTLTVKTYRKKITEKEYSSVHRNGDRFKVGEIVAVADIEDTGTGIPEDKIASVFDPFFTTKSPGQGTGLGLSVSKNIIELHGGAIHITNRKESGVRVTILLKPHRRKPS